MFPSTARRSLASLIPPKIATPNAVVSRLEEGSWVEGTTSPTPSYVLRRIPLTYSPPAQPLPELPPSSTSTPSYPRDLSPSLSVQVD